VNGSHSKTVDILPVDQTRVLSISPGGQSDKNSYSYVPPNLPPVSRGDTKNSGSQTYDPKPKYPWGADPSYRSPAGGGGSGSSSSSNSKLDANKFSNSDEWVDDGYVWDKGQEKDGEEEYGEENNEAPGKLQADIDFEYKYDSNGNPTLLIPNVGRFRQRRPFTRVEYDQTASHIHHAPDFNIALPANFDMKKYIRMSRADRIAYANQMLTRETIINYQNEIGKSMCPIFGPLENTFSVPGFAGKNKIGTELTFRKGPDRTMMSIIREDGVHISSFPLKESKLQEIARDNFWVLKDRDI